MKRTSLVSVVMACLLFFPACTTLAPANMPPQAAFSTNPSSGEAPLQVSFNASASSDPDGQIVSYTWDFGDGSSAQGMTTSHTYQSAGVYSIRLTVRDDDGESRGISHSIQVTQQTTASYSVTVGGITGEFEQNEYAATLKYEGTYIEVRGYVRSIGIDLRDQPYIAVVAAPGDSVFAPGVNCYFEQAGPHPGLAELREGDYVTVVAEFSFYSSLFNTVYLEKSRIQ